MKPKKSLWKKIEHWIVLVLFFGTIILGLVNVFFWEELGFVKDTSSYDLPEPPPCHYDPRYPC